MSEKISPLKMRKLKSKGWEIGTASVFLGLSKEESKMIEKKIAHRKSPKKVSPSDSKYLSLSR